jgi:hypothetical protein
MKDSAPLWLQITVACIPLLAAMVAGVFALTNTVSRRAERLKNLVEIWKDYPEPLNPDYALERVMLRELQAIDRATTPILRWYRRFRVVLVGLFVGFYVTVALHLLHIGKISLVNQVAVYLSIVVCAAALFVNNFRSKRQTKFRESYDQVFWSLDEPASQIGQPSDEPVPRDSDAQQAS